MKVTSPPPPVPCGAFLREFVGKFLVYLSLDSCIHAMRMFLEWRREDNFCIQCRIL